MATLQEKYRNEVLPALQKELGIANPMAVPRLEKISLNMGVGAAIDDSKLLDAACRDMATIAGQAPAVTTAKVSVSNFRLRQGYRIGCRVTLRGTRMYEFLERLINAAIPRIRDFRGVKDTSFDKQGNFSMGVEEINIFPEIDPDKSDQSFGMDIAMVIRNSSGADASRRFLRMMGIPFVDPNEQ